MEKEIARIKYKSVGKTKIYKANLKKWLSKKIQFDNVKSANFKNGMCVGIVEFDKNNCIYLIVPEDIFKKSNK